MKKLLLIACIVNLSIAHATELSDLPTNDFIGSIFSDFQENPTAYLKDYTEQPPEAKLKNQDIGSIARAQANQSDLSQIVIDARENQEVATAEIQHRQLGVNNLSEFDGLIEVLQEKYSDCVNSVHCALPELSNETDFKEAIGDLAVLGEMSSELPSSFNENSTILFQGKAMECKKYDIGFMNCCNSTGWGKFISQCSAQENELGQAREKGVAIFLGTKKTGHKPNRKKHDVFCVFDSKLASLIQERGRQWQLSIGFGDAKTPNCRGISANELSRIDFDAIDLSEAYQDISKNISLPNQKLLTKQVEKSATNCANDSNSLNCVSGKKEGHYA